MHRTTSVLALGLFLGLAPIGALAQTQSGDTDTQEQLTQPSDTQESTESTESEPLESDEQQATETEEPETDEQQATETEEPETDEQQATETEEPVTDDQQATETEPTDAEEEPEVAAPAEEVIPAQEENEVLASSLMGTEVRLADESIGTVSDLIIGEDNMIKGVVVGVGGFLGIGEKNVALPMEQITVQPTEVAGEVELSTNATREQLEAFEEFKTAADIQSEQEAAQTQQQTGAQQPPAVPTQPTQPQQ